MENKYNFIKNRNRNAQNFDKDNISITKAGKTYNVYESIQEAREDTEIYPTLERYGCIDRMQLNIQDTEKYYQDIRELKDLRGTLDQQIKATEMWNALPLDVRAQFGHSMNEFTIKGEAWLKAKIDEAKALEMKENNITQPKDTIQPIKEEKINE